MSATATSRQSDDTSRAFALGWEMSQLYRYPTAGNGWQATGENERLRSLMRLTPAERSQVRLLQIIGTITQLKPRLELGGDDLAKYSDIESKAEELQEQLAASATERGVRTRLEELHHSLMRALLAGDPQVAKAYGVGRALGDTCHAPRDLPSLKGEFNVYRLATLGESLADLASLFPAHSSRTVRLSLSAWRRWAADPKVNTVVAEQALPGSGSLKQDAHARIAREKPLDWERDGPGVLSALSRQGEIWRALLAGDKRGEEMLELRDYVSAATQVLPRAVRLLRGLWVPLLAVLALVGVGTGLLLNYDSTGKLVTGAAALAAAVGLGWKAILGALGGAIERLQAPLWGAALDDVIAHAITEAPPGVTFEWPDPKDAAPATGPSAALHVAVSQVTDDEQTRGAAEIGQNPV